MSVNVCKYMSVRMIVRIVTLFASKRRIALGRLLKTLTRTVPLNCYANRHGRRAFRDIESAYKEMLDEMADHASDRSPEALGSACAHKMWVKLVNPHQGTTPLAELQLFTNTIKHR